MSTILLLHFFESSIVTLCTYIYVISGGMFQEVSFIFIVFARAAGVQEAISSLGCCVNFGGVLSEVSCYR